MILIDANEARWDESKNHYTVKWVREIDKIRNDDAGNKKIPDSKKTKWAKIDLSRIDDIERVGPDIVILGPNGNLAIERKDCRDFISSVVNRHLFEQIYDGLVRVEGARPILLVEGNWNRAFAKREYLRPLSMGAFAKFVATTNLQFVQTESASMTAHLIKFWNDQANDTKETVDAPRRVFIPPKKPVGLRDIAYTMMYAFPGLGGQTALNIVEKMSEPKTIANLVSMPLARLKKIAGEKRGELMYYTFVCPLEREAKSPLFSLDAFFQEELE